MAEPEQELETGFLYLVKWLTVDFDRVINQVRSDQEQVRATQQQILAEIADIRLSISSAAAINTQSERLDKSAGGLQQAVDQAPEIPA